MKWMNLLALGFVACSDDSKETGTDTDPGTGTDTEETDTVEDTDTYAASCEGAHEGAFTGGESGTITGVLHETGQLLVQFSLPDVGTVNHEGDIEADGTVYGQQADVTINGTYDFTTCSGSGTWSASDAGLDGTWELHRIE